HGLGGGVDVVHLDSTGDQPDDRAGGGHAVVGVGTPRGAAQGGGRDLEPVVQLGDAAAHRAQFGCQGGQTVRLVAAQVGDPGQAGAAVGQRAQGGDGGGELADGGQVQVDGGQAFGSDDDEGPV